MESTLYKINIQSINGDFELETENVEEALAKFKPEFITGKVIVKATKGNRSFEKLLFVPLARKIFYNPFALKTFARTITRALT